MAFWVVLDYVNMYSSIFIIFIILLIKIEMRI